MQPHEDDMLIVWDKPDLRTRRMWTKDRAAYATWYLASDGSPTNIQIVATEDNLGTTETLRYARSAARELRRLLAGRK